MGFPVDTADGTVDVVDKLGDGTLIAEDGSRLRPTTDALVSEVIEAAQAIEAAVEEIGDVVSEAYELAGEFFGSEEEEAADPAADEAAGEEKADGNEDQEAPQAA